MRPLRTQDVLLWMGAAAALLALAMRRAPDALERASDAPWALVALLGALALLAVLKLAAASLPRLR